MNKTWRFPESGRVQNKGAGTVVTDEFNNYPLNNLSREIIQNSLDARAGDKKVIVEFHQFSTPIDCFPEIQKFAEYAMGLYNEYNKNEKTPKEKIFVNNIIMALKGKKVNWLRISDFNTSGLWGASTPADQETPWFAFIKSAGKNQKGEMSGGSKGLGKDAIFANSILKTMFVSTLTKNLETKEEEMASIGIARLLSLTLKDECPENPDWTQGIGFYIDDEEKAKKFLSPSKELFEMDPEFDRRSMGYGTDIYLPCFSGDSEKWDEIVIREAIISFLPAIMNNDLEVVISYDSTNVKQVINSANITPFISGKGWGKKEAKALYNVMKSPQTKVVKYEEKEGFEMTLMLLQDQIDGLGEVYEYRLPTKMKIISEAKNSDVIYTGILLIEGKEICKRLRSIENATHSKWSQFRWKDSGYTKQEIEEALKRVDDFISEECAKFGSRDYSDAVYYDVEGWNAEEDSVDMSVGEHKEIGLPTNEVVFDMKSDTVKNPRRKPFKKKGNVINDKGNAETDIEDTGTPGEGEGETTHPIGHNNGTGGEIRPGEKPDIYDPTKGSKIVSARRTISALEARIPSVEPSEGIFDLVFNPNKTGTDVYIELLKAGIDGETEPTTIKSAILDGQELEIVNNKIHMDKIDKGKQYRIHLKLDENINYIWEVNIDAEE